MGLTVSEGAGSFELAPAGTFAARCFKLIDLGTQQTEYQGAIKHQPKILISWELIDPDAPLMADGRPFAISKRYTASLHEKAQLRKDLAAWRGRDFSADELKAFNVEKLTGAYCLLNVIHADKDGKTYANIASIMPLPKSMPKPAPVNSDTVFAIDRFDQLTFDTFGEKLKEQIKASPEYQAIGKAAPAAAPAANPPGAFNDLEDDIPF